MDTEDKSIVERLTRIETLSDMTNEKVSEILENIEKMEEEIRKIKQELLIYKIIALFFVLFLSGRDLLPYLVEILKKW